MTAEAPIEWLRAVSKILDDFAGSCRAAARSFPMPGEELGPDGPTDPEGAEAGAERGLTTSYAHVYELCRDPRRAGGIGAVDVLIDHLEGCFEQWVGQCLLAAGLEGGMAPPHEPRHGGAMVADPWACLVALCRRFLLIKRVAAVQFLYVDHNCRGAVQMLLRKCVRQQFQLGDNEERIGSLLDAVFTMWTTGGDALERRDGGPSDVIRLLDDLSLHSITAAFCHRMNDVLRAYAGRIVRGTAAPYESGAGSPLRPRATAPATERLLSLQTAFLHGEDLIVLFLGFEERRPVTMGRVAACTTALYEGASSCLEVVQLLERSVGPLFLAACLGVDAADIAPHEATEKLHAILRGLCSSHETLLAAACRALDAAVTGYLGDQTALLPRGSDAHYALFELLAASLSCCSRFTASCDCPSWALARLDHAVNQAMRRFVDSREGEVIGACLSALQRWVSDPSAPGPLPAESSGPLAAIIGYLGQKDLFVDALSRSLAQDALQFQEGGSASWDLYTAALEHLSQAVCQSLFAHPLALLRDLRGCALAIHEINGLLPFPCSLSTLCVARWARHCHPPLLVSTRGLSELGPTGAVLEGAALHLVHCDTRSLRWVLHAGTVSVACRFDTLSFPVMLTTTPCLALVLGQLEALTAGQGTVAVAALCAACPWLPEAVIMRFLRRASRSGIILLDEPSATCGLCQRYGGNERRLRLLMHSRELTGDVAASLPTRDSGVRMTAGAGILAGRMRALEATVVRIMKERRSAPHEELLEQALRGMARIAPLTVAQFKTCVQTLIDREFLRRLPSGGYEYIA